MKRRAFNSVTKGLARASDAVRRVRTDAWFFDATYDTTTLTADEQSRLLEIVAELDALVAKVAKRREES